VPDDPERREAARPFVPDTREPPVASVPRKPTPAPVEDREVPPIELPGFATALPGVASGIKPFPDGLTWLKARGYKTVLHLRLPGEDNSAARRQVEMKGLRYETLEVSPARLTLELANQFSSIVTDPSRQPLFVYDKDGSLAGGLWYLHFRRLPGVSAEKAVAEATRLGLKKDEDDAHRVMWLAIQKLLEKR
jgi:hypothetical protein